METTIHLPKILGVLLFALLFRSASAEGTKEVMTSGSSGAALYISYDIGQGSYRGAPIQNRIYFHISDYNSENLYFGLTPYGRTAAPAARTDIYYRIFDPSGNLVQTPARVGHNNSSGLIASYADAVFGPKIPGLGGSQGYDPITFIPGQNGDYYIEIYPSSDNGASQLTAANTPIMANAPTVCTFFDFTVANKVNGTKYTGRVHCQNWSFITYNTTSKEGDQSVAFQGSVYGLTSDKVVNKVSFNSGFKPLAFVAAMNSYGVTNTGNFETDRNSVVSGSNAPVLNNSYKMFLNQPDAIAFPAAAIPTAPSLYGGIIGCPGVYTIPYTMEQSGDIRLLLDLNGTPGYQSGTSDRYLYKYGVPAGNNILNWDGIDGMGTMVVNSATIQLSISLMKGRTNLPMFDAELNANGLSVSSVAPQVNANLTLYWNDANLTNSGLFCDTTNNNKNNNLTGAGVNRSEEGQVSPAHAWDGTGAGISILGPGNGVGSATQQTCDDFGNVRTLNTWFWGLAVSSGTYTFTLPNCNLSLPVHFISVNGKAAGDRTYISWKVAREVNVAYYEVERRLETGSFIKIARVDAAAGTDHSKEYSYSDEGILQGHPYYYRIKGAEKDGQTFYSNIVKVSPLDRLPALGVSPNPVNESFSLQVNAATAQKTEVVITDMYGMLIAARPVVLTAGRTVIPMNVSNLAASGIYLLTMRIDDKVHHIKLIK